LGLFRINGTAFFVPIHSRCAANQTDFSAPLRQPENIAAVETFAKSKIKQEARNAPLFPHRREFWLNVNNSLFLREFMNIKPDFRLRGDDDISYF